MIVPIFGKSDETLGTASVQMTEGDVSVEFYLKPEVSLRDDAKAKLVRELKKLVTKGR